MLDILMFALNIAWKVLAIAIGWMLLCYIVKNGRGTVREILDTITLGARALMAAMRKKLVRYLTKETEEPKKEEDEEVNDGRVEAHII